MAPTLWPLLCGLHLDSTADTDIAEGRDGEKMATPERKIFPQMSYYFRNWPGDKFLTEQIKLEDGQVGSGVIKFNTVFT